MGLKNIGDILSGQQRGGRPSARSPKPRQNDFFDFLKLLAQWPHIVGDKLSRQTLPLRIRGDKLFIMTSHPLYAQQLQYFEGEIISKIKKLFPHSKTHVKRMAFQATQYFDTIKREQAAHIPGGTDGEDGALNDQFHPYNPQYLKIKKQIKTQLEDCEGGESDRELSSLLEKMNVLHRQKEG